jgi:hypothetical protein
MRIAHAITEINEGRSAVRFALRIFGGPDAAYLIASALGGEPTPPGMLRGAEVKKNS